MPIGLEFNFSCVNCSETNTDVRGLNGFPSGISMKIW